MLAHQIPSLEALWPKLGFGLGLGLGLGVGVGLGLGLALTLALTPLKALWPKLAPGGVFIVEDLTVGP